jgi:flagellar export protein FliJ
VAFVFRLEKILAVRRRQEGAARRRHADVRRECARARGILEALQNKLHGDLENLDGLKRRDEITPESLRLHSLHLGRLRQSVEEARESLGRAAAEMAVAEAEVAEAHRAREALERLRDREEGAWRQAQNRREARAADEIAVSRPRRGREEESRGA